MIHLRAGWFGSFRNFVKCRTKQTEKLLCEHRLFKIWQKRATSISFIIQNIHAPPLDVANKIAFPPMAPLLLSAINVCIIA